MLHRVGEGELALGIVALCPAPACRHYGRQVVDGPGQVRWIVDVLAESVVAHADVPPEVEDAALPVGNQAPEPEHQRIVSDPDALRSEEHTSELQSLMRISYAVFRLKKNKKEKKVTTTHHEHI